MDNKIDCKSNSSNLLGILFAFSIVAFQKKNSFLTPTSKQPNQFDTVEQQTMQLFTKGKRPKKTHFDGCDCVLGNFYQITLSNFSLPVCWTMYGYFREKLHANHLWELKG